METILKNNEQISGDTVRAQINERSFMRNMEHMFSSSFSVIGELLQNGRRAEATTIDVKLDAKTRKLTISDNGIGIQSFAKLLDLATSGWTAEQVQLTEKPFGMGFFSVVFAAERVVVTSRGQQLDFTREDIIEGRQLRVREHGEQPLNGITTVIELCNVSEKLLPVSGSVDQFERNLKELVAGFPVDVVFNTVLLPRPNRMDLKDGKWVMTGMGPVSIQGIHRGTTLAQPAHNTNVRMYLQGLPIEQKRLSFPGAEAPYIVHLDSAQFTAQMPDRTHLFNSDEQMKTITAKFNSLVVDFLHAQKRELSPREFVKAYWDDAARFGVRHLFNDVPFVPCTLFQTVSEVRIPHAGADVHTTLSYHDKDTVISREQLLELEQGVWMDVCTSVDDEHWAATALAVMQKLQTYCVDSHDVHQDHWINAIAHRYTDMTFQVNVEGMSERMQSFTWSDRTADIRMATSCEVKIRSLADNALALNVKLDSGWLFTPVLGPNEDSENVLHWDFDCWLMSHDYDSHPVNALASFVDEYDHFNEEYEKDAILDWDNKIALLEDSHTSAILSRILVSEYPQLSDKNLGEITIVTGTQRSVNGGDEYRAAGLKVAALDDAMMATICAALKKQSGVTVTADQMTRAISFAARPGLCTGGKRDGDYRVGVAIVSP